MKKIICVLVLSMCIACTAAGCGGDGGSSSSAQQSQTVSEGASAIFEGRLVSVSAKEIGSYVKLGKYKGIEVDRTVDDVTDDQVQEQITNTLMSSAEEVKDEDAQVEDGDIANIDYVGTKDGEAFDGGTSEDYDLTIGSGQFIEGFEEGLVGAKIGETRDLDLTFPENYTSEELAGQDVVFTVTVNSIRRAPELTEDWVKENTEYDSIDAYEKGVRQSLETSNEQNADSIARNTAWSQVLEECEVKEYPEKDLEEAKQSYSDMLQEYADQMGQSVDEFMESQGMTQEQFEEESQQYAEYQLKQDLAVQAIMDEEGFTLADDGNNAAAEQMEKDYGMSIDELIDQYGETSVKESVALSRVMDFIMDNAKINTVAGSSDGKDGVLTDEEEADSDDDTETLEDEEE